MRALKRVAVVMAFTVCGAVPDASSVPATADQPAYIGVCPEGGPGAGAPAREEKYCRFFIRFNGNTSAPLDPRIAENLGVTSADQTRSIGFVIVIGKYPFMKDSSGKPMDLSAAEVDGDNLTSFLINEQKFDEVIALRDGDATPSNINYFLYDYLINRAGDFNKRARLFIAYSGHGRPTSQTEEAAFLLSNIKDVDGSDNVYLMKSMSDAVKKLSGLYFHVATLINACWGGNFFSVGGWGDDEATDEPGALALTAGPADKTVEALDSTRGSLFFDFVTDGVRRGVGDPQWWTFHATEYDINGKPIKKDGLTRLHPLADYLKNSYFIINNMKKSDINFEKVDNPWIGPTQGGPEIGGFFFLTDGQIGGEKDLAEAYGHGTTQSVSFSVPAPLGGSNSAGNETLKYPLGQSRKSQKSPVTQHATLSSTQAIWPVPAQPNWSLAAQRSWPPVAWSNSEEELRVGPQSSIVGHPEIKVFKPPKVYPIHGFDVSSADGYIDWRTLANSEHPRFIYMRALGWKGQDPSFVDRWSKSGAMGFDRGAYVKFDFCKSADTQLAELRETVKVDPMALPVAIELVTPSTSQDREQGVSQTPCFAASGVERAKDDILKLAAATLDAYGKTPLLFGNAHDLSALIDNRADDFMIWLAAYPNGNARALVGANPWTLWQYSGALDVKGIGPRTTGEVFFGTEAQYEEFKKGKGNVARDAVAGEPFIASGGSTSSKLGSAGVNGVKLSPLIITEGHIGMALSPTFDPSSIPFTSTMPALPF